jgi:glycogen debranching enzyme
MATYNPMSYHNGSVWPHDNSLIGAGFYAYGETDAGHAVTKALFDAASADPLNRLPELYCGFARTDDAHDKPVSYPVGCSPQAWASGSLPLLTRAMLGLEVDPTEQTLVIRPSLPEWLSVVSLDGLRVLGRSGCLTVKRAANGYEIAAEGLPISPRL